MKILVIIIQILNDIGSIIIKTLLRVNGAKIGKNTYIDISSKILVKNLHIGNDVRILKNVKIKGKKINIGHNCVISDDVMITGTNSLTLGDKSYIGKKVHLDLSRDIKVGEDVGIGENTVVWTHGFFPPADKGYPVTFGGVEIKNNAWVSTNIVILPNVTIGENVIIGAGSVVNKTAEDDIIIAGNPAKKIKNVDEILHKKSFITIMSEIFNHFNIIEISPYICNFNFENIKCYIVENYDFKTKFNFDKNAIILFKNCESITLIETNAFLWVNFNSRIANKSNNKKYLNVINILRNQGIRFIYKY
jgi:acetyltransferase-like isoleucine patch superfamily enzyme